MDNNLKGNPSAINYGSGFIPKGLNMKKVMSQMAQIAKGNNILKKSKKKTANKLPKNMSGQYGQKGKIK